MRAHYDFSKMKAKKNPYIKFLKQPITVRLDKDSIDYFKSLSEDIFISRATTTASCNCGHPSHK